MEEEPATGNNRNQGTCLGTKPGALQCKSFSTPLIRPADRPAMIGDATLFQRADNIEAGWRAVQPALDAWSSGRTPMATYPAGSAGPEEADDLLARDGLAWRPL